MFSCFLSPQYGTVWTCSCGRSRARAGPPNTNRSLGVVLRGGILPLLFSSVATSLNPTAWSRRTTENLQLRRISFGENFILYLLLKELGIGLCVFHAFRRFGNTFLRQQLWSRWSAQILDGVDLNMSDHYGRSREDVQYRRDVTNAKGVAFELLKT